MSIYNMINGVSSATWFILPMLGKHPDEYPRFRDCFVNDEEHPEYDDHIHIYTRTGGGNREGYNEENKQMMQHANYVTDFDDSYDCTYASWIFSVPDKWRVDFEKIKTGDILELSKEYREEINRVFPKLKEKFDEIFTDTGNEPNAKAD